NQPLKVLYPLNLNQFNDQALTCERVGHIRRTLEAIMKTSLMAMVVMASCTTFGLAQTPGQSQNPQNRNQVLQQQPRQLLQPSPGEIVRCYQPREVLNASSRDACRAIGR